MAKERKLVRIETPQPQPGFLGAGHTARRVVTGDFKNTDPFIILMDDELNKQDSTPAGGPHPHAGFETVSLLLAGEIGDEAHTMHAGDFQVMTAGSGIVHSETINKNAKMRLLQMWLNLPKAQRWAEPRVQDLPVAHAPTLEEDGVKIKLYSGALAGMRSPVVNYTPLVVADVSIAAGRRTVQVLPGNYNSFVYVIKGTIRVGENGDTLSAGQVGWLDLQSAGEETELQMQADREDARVVLYGARPTGDEIVSYGPFIADSPEQISNLYKQYRQGHLQHIAQVPAAQRVLL